MTSRLGIVAVGLAAVVVGAALLIGLIGPNAGRATPRVGGPVRVAEEVPVTTMNAGAGVASNSPSIVEDPADGRFVVMANRIDAPDFSCSLQVSGDHGRTWLPVEPVPDLPTGAEKCYAPEAAFDRNLTLYYLFVGLHGSGNQPMGAFIATSRDRGRSWSSPHQVLGAQNFGVRMAIDRSQGDLGRIHMVWIQAADAPAGGFSPSSNPILAAYSDDGGRSFSKPVRVSDPARRRVVGPALTLGPDHAVHVGYYDLGGDAVDYQGLEGATWQGKWSIVVTTSTDGGRSFGPGMVVDDQIGPDGRVILIFTMPPPALVAVADRSLCAAWTDARTGDADAVLRCSANRGRTWDPLRRLNDDPVGNGRTQYQPHVSVAPDGRLDAVFYDRRADPANVSNDVYYTYSTDGGRTFAPNRKLTSDSSNTMVGQQYTNASAQGLVEWGSRIGLLSTDERAVAAWTDTRNIQFGIAQDIFSTVVTFPATSRPPAPWFKVLGGILVVVGLGSVVLGASQHHRRQVTPGGPDATPSRGQAG
ncbi:MAG: glycoside hydrolase [Actinomycetota bacterium]|nr:glycoside hydrolase [Actinomycetota bacterium]